jgi:hypothetical protein
MRYSILLAAGTLAGAAAVAPELAAQRNRNSGTWEAELRWRPRQNAGRVLWIHFDAESGRTRRDHEFGFTVKVSELSTLAASDSRWSGPARFELRRDAGVLRFEGEFQDGLGEGTWTFAANEQFRSELGLDHQLDDDEWLAMLIHDVRIDWVRGLRQAGVESEDANDLIAMRIHGVKPEFARELAALGYRNPSSDKLVALRIHQVDPDFIRGIREGVDEALDLDELVSFRIHKVTPEFVREISTLGYSRPDADELVSMRIHGVTPAFIRSITETGLKDIDLDELVAFRIHRVDADFVQEAVRAGVRLDPDDIVSYRIHGRRRPGR